MMKVGINGLGRIGRSILRHLWLNDKWNCVQINDINKDINNLAYLIKYDSVYGNFKADVNVLNSNCIEIISSKKKWNILVTNYDEIEKAGWVNQNAEYIIECSGLERNAAAAKLLVDKGIKNVVVTNTFYDADFTVIIGVNDQNLNKNNHKVISTSICDANAIAPILYTLNHFCLIEHCFITTLHPGLSYQNILDGPLRSQSNLNNFYTDYYALGRSSMGNIIPKSTTVGDVLEHIIPELSHKITSFSQRVPTTIVCSADISLVMKDTISKQDILNLFGQFDANIVKLTKEMLISCDYIAENASCVIDAKWLSVTDNKFVRINVWYDNEWGYSGRVIDILNML